MKKGKIHNFPYFVKLWIFPFYGNELFFTGTAAEVVPIKSVDESLIADGKRGGITTILQRKYFDQVRGKRTTFSEWLTPIS